MDFLSRLKNYIAASYPALWIQTHEETRICSEIAQGLKKANRVFEWDCQEGLYERVDQTKKKYQDTNTIPQLFEAIYGLLGKEEGCVFLLKDFHLSFENPIKKAEYTRILRNALGVLKAKSSMIIIVSPVVKIATELSKDIQLLDYSLPDETAINERLEFIYQSVRSSKKLELPEDIRESAVEAAKGMTFAEVENAFALAIVTNKQFNADFVSTVFKEKIQQVKKGGLLNYIEPDVNFANVGGLDGLKSWIRVRRNAYTKAAREFGLPYPKGFLAAGIPGCGKTLIAKATAREYGFPLFHLDIGKLFDKFVGGTEANVSGVIKTVEGIGRCVLLLDEIEKYLNEDAVSGSGDSGTGSRSFGTILTWLSDRDSPIFIIGTSNNHMRLPPELKRKGRFDEIFWVDLPSDVERQDIFNVVIKKYKRNPKDYDLKALSKHAEGFSGIEIDEAYKNALYHAFDTGEKMDTNIVLDSVTKITPQSKLNEAHYNTMKERAKVLTPASTLPVAAETTGGRKLKI